MKDEHEPSGARGEAETALHGAAWTGCHKLVRRLVRRGHDVNVLDDAGESPLHGAANATTVHTLLRLGARIDIAAKDSGFTPLHWAAGWGGLCAVRALVRHGADVSARDHRGRTAHDLAVAHGKFRTARWLATRVDSSAQTS